MIHAISIGYKWLVIYPALVISTFILGPMLILLSFIGLADQGSSILATRWARFNLRCCLIKANITGLEHVQPGQSYIIAANHQSLIDIYLVYGFSPVEFKWVMKKELGAVPILGAACKAMGHILIDRSNPQSAIDSINEAAKKIRNGMCIVFFPEGTRSDNENVMPFKKGAFRLAIELGIPILPMSLHNTGNLVPNGTLNWKPGQVSMQIHEPITTRLLTPDDVDDLNNQTRQQIINALTQP
jgi:1-acyl-sn-glycerol-3-phosphate acyltransferase